MHYFAVVFWNRPTNSKTIKVRIHLSLMTVIHLIKLKNTECAPSCGSTNKFMPFPQVVAVKIHKNTRLPLWNKLTRRNRCCGKTTLTWILCLQGFKICHIIRSISSGRNTYLDIFYITRALTGADVCHSMSSWLVAVDALAPHKHKTCSLQQPQCPVVWEMPIVS